MLASMLVDACRCRDRPMIKTVILYMYITRSYAATNRDVFLMVLLIWSNVSCAFLHVN